MPVSASSRVDVDVERVVVDDHGLGGVGGLLAGLGDDGGDRLADVADAVAGEQRPGDGRVERRRDRLQAEVGRREDADHAGHRRRLGRVDRRDRAVGDRRADVGDVGRAGELGDVVEVVEVHAAGGEELRVLLADDPIAEDAAGHSNPPVVVHLRVARRTVASRLCRAAVDDEQPAHAERAGVSGPLRPPPAASVDGEVERRPASGRRRQPQRDTPSERVLERARPSVPRAMLPPWPGW